MHVEVNGNNDIEGRKKSAKKGKLLSYEGMRQHMYLTYIELVIPNPALDHSREEADSKEHKTEARGLHVCSLPNVSLAVCRLLLLVCLLLSGFDAFMCDSLPQPYKGNRGIASMSLFSQLGARVDSWKTSIDA